MSNNIVIRVEKHPLQSEVNSEETVQCDKCGKIYGVGAWPFCPHSDGAGVVSHEYPFTTTAFNGKPIEVTSRAHEKSLMVQYGCVKRDDVAWTEKEYLGYNWKTGKQEYREGSGMGLPGVWF